jgi:hypothetical protein
VRLRTNRVLAATVFCALAGFPACAGAESGDYLSRRETISLSAGNASRANIAIQTPTPWPPYVNDTAIPGYGPRAVNVIRNLNMLPTGDPAAGGADAPQPQ